MLSDTPKMAYPLLWAMGRQRTDQRQAVRSHVSLARATDDLLYELQLLDAVEIVISCNVEPLKQFPGYPERFELPDDPGVAVYFTVDGIPYIFACDDFEAVQGNMRDIGQLLREKRMLSQLHQCASIEREFAGYKAAVMPVEASPRRKPWWKVLYVSPDAPLAVIEAAYKGLARIVHSDLAQNSDDAAMAALNRAIEEARLMRR
ncbi:MAG: hypothetical protein KME42_19925 [Tildeniella nuda ZEHNDER 1965/U140]|nr:hypothetical protein [Tildeniella nuda ZEHNDER 1965/U140]